MDNVISFSRKAREYGKGICRHKKITIDENLICECRECGEQINPAKWILDLAREEGNLEFRINELKQEIEKQKNRLRVQCVHCLKMTPISKKL